MKRELPRIITLVTGVFLALQYFVPHRTSAHIYETLMDWLIVVGMFAIILGILGLARMHLERLQQRQSNWLYSVTLLVGLFGMITLGFWGQDLGSPFVRAYFSVLNPIQATMFAMLAFYIASAAYRAFRGRTALATILLVSAVLVMLGRVPLGELVWPRFHLGSLTVPSVAEISDWLINVPNLAAKRAIYIGLGLGGAATALKIVLGVEAPHLRG
jgi:multisubunit Na+/H+ antiporter MnhG subunit